MATDDTQDTPSPNASLAPHRHIVFPFDKPREPFEGLVFGTDDLVDFRLPGHDKGYRSMSRKCFRIYVNELGAWMFQNLSLSECKVDEDVICSDHCRHTPGLSAIALHPETASLIRIFDIEITIRLPIGHFSSHPSTSWHSTSSSTTQTLKGGTSMIPSRNLSTPTIRYKYHELRASAVKGQFYVIKTLVNKETGSRVLGKIDTSSSDKVAVREGNLSKTYANLLKLCKVSETPVLPC